MLQEKESLEKKGGKVVLRLEELSVTSDVIDSFLTSLYSGSGKLRDIRKHETSTEFILVGLLPPLVNLAHKIISNPSLPNHQFPSNPINHTRVCSVSFNVLV